METPCASCSEPCSNCPQKNTQFNEFGVLKTGDSCENYSAQTQTHIEKDMATYMTLVNEVIYDNKWPAVKAIACSALRKAPPISE